MSNKSSKAPPSRRKSMVAAYRKQQEEEEETTPTITKVLVTLNPNKAVKNAADFEQKKQTFLDILGDFEENLEEICGREPFVKKITTKNLSLELGKKFKRLHAHFILKIQHFVKNYSLDKLRWRIKDFFDLEGIALSNSWAVFITLAPAYKENYATKEARRLSADEIAEEGDPEELQRLSDERPEKHYSVGSHHLNALDGKQAMYIVQTGKRSYNTKKTQQLEDAFKNMSIKE